jgi:hypothetical protein
MNKLEMKFEIMEMNISDLEKLVALDMLDNGYIPFHKADIIEYWSNKL